MCAHDEDQDEHLPDSQNPFSPRPCNEPATIGERLHRWISELKFANYPAGVCSDKAEKEEAEKAGNETEDGEGLR